MKKSSFLEGGFFVRREKRLSENKNELYGNKKVYPKIKMSYLRVNQAMQK